MSDEQIPNPQPVGEAGYRTAKVPALQVVPNVSGVVSDVPLRWMREAIPRLHNKKGRCEVSETTIDATQWKYGHYDPKMTDVRVVQTHVWPQFHLPPWWCDQEACDKQKDSRLMTTMRMQATAEKMRMRAAYARYILLTGQARKDGAK